MRSLYEFGRFLLDPEEHRLTLDGKQVAVTPKAFDILVVLVQRAPRLVTKEQLMKEVWPDAYVEEANLTVHISALRKTLTDASDHKRYIETVPRRGYRFAEPVREIKYEEEVAAREDLSALLAASADAEHVTGFALTEAGFVAPEHEVSNQADNVVVATPSDSHDTGVVVPTLLGSSDDVAQRSTTRRVWPFAAALGMLIVTAIMFGVPSLPTSSARRGDLSWERIATEGRLQQVLAAEAGATDPALSPDARTLAFVLDDGKGATDLYVTRIGGGGQLRLTNDDRVEQYPRFSPDGEWLLFSSLDGRTPLPQVRVVPVLGGPSRLITSGNFASWSPRGDRIAYIGLLQPDALPAVYTSLLDGTDVREILPASSAYPFLRHTSWSRDGKFVAVMRGTGGVAGEIWLIPAEGGEPRRFTQAPAEVWSTYPTFTPDDSGIIYASNRGGAANLWVQMFESGRSVRLTSGPGPEGNPTISDNGVIAFLSSRNRDELVVHTPSTGATRPLLTHAPYLWAPVFSPDGQEIAFSRSEVDGSWHIWTIDVDGEQPARQITSGQLGELHPRYTADGKWIVYHSWGTPRRVWRVARGGGSPVQVTNGDYEDGYADPSPDGQMIAFARTDGPERIHIAPLIGGEARALTSRPSTVPRWSPDGQLIAFSPSRAFNGGIFVIAPDGSGERRLTEVGGWPVWWPDGKQISYLATGPNGAQQIWSVSINGGAPRLIDTLSFDGSNYPFDVAKDGRRIIATRNVRISREIWLLQPPGTQPTTN